MVFQRPRARRRCSCAWWRTRPARPMRAAEISLEPWPWAMTRILDRAGGGGGRSKGRSLCFCRLEGALDTWLASLASGGRRSVPIAGSNCRMSSSSSSSSLSSSSSSSLSSSLSSSSSHCSSCCCSSVSPLQAMCFSRSPYFSLHPLRSRRPACGRHASSSSSSPDLIDGRSCLRRRHRRRRLSLVAHYRFLRRRPTARNCRTPTLHGSAMSLRSWRATAAKGTRDQAAPVDADSGPCALLGCVFGRRGGRCMWRCYADHASDIRPYLRCPVDMGASDGESSICGANPSREAACFRASTK